MGYTRKFQRSHENNEELQVKERPLYQRVVAAVTAAGFVLQPLTAFASEITRPGGTNLATNDVTNIYAEKIVGDAAVNVFDKFNVTPNNIVNMYFKTETANIEKNNLVNFVNSRINIDGTVNAVKNNTIGGNLYFLSKDGMAVGRSGVINAGALYVATPTESAFNKYKGYTDNPKDENSVNNFNALLTDYWSAIPVNSSGTISVLGKINTVDGINMRAGKSILIGKTEDDINNSNINKQAALTSGVTDFSNLVNIGNINANLAGNLQVQADADANGDIVLTAWANEVNGTDANWAHNNAAENKNLVAASVESYGTITSRGSVDISATATNGTEFSAAFDDSEVSDSSGDAARDVWGQMVKTKADVRIEGDVTAGNKADITAYTGNYYLSAVSENANENSQLGDGYRYNNTSENDPLRYTEYAGTLAGVFTANEAAAYAFLGGEASVTVGENATITANGAEASDVNTLNISADSIVRTGVGASTAPVKFASLKQTNKVPSAAVTVAQIQNDASVVIEGELVSNGNTNINAKADTSLEAGAINTTKEFSENSDLIKAAVVVGVGDTNSSVVINNTVNSAGDLKIAATTANSVDTTAMVTSDADSFGATAVNVTVYDSSADVQVNGAVTGKNVSVIAGNATVKNEVTADTAVGSDHLTSALTQFGANSLTGSAVTGFVTGLRDKIIPQNESTKLDEMAKLFSVGASVAVADESSNAKVTLGKNAVVQAVSGDASAPAYGDVKITANNVIEDTQMYATGETNNYKEGVDNKALVNASVLYAEMDNSASVILEGGDKHDASNAKYTQIVGKNVDVRANSAFQYNRVKKMIGELLQLCETVKDAYGGNYPAKIKELQELAKAYQKKLNADPDYANSAKGNEEALALAAAAEAVSLNNNGLTQAENIGSGPFNVVGAAFKFADPNNYANFRAGSSTSGKSENGAKVAVAGSANVNELNNTAQVIVGKNSVIEGKTGAVNLAATVEQKDVALNGKLTSNSGGEVGVGGVLGLHRNDTNSLVAVAEGAQITAGGAARQKENGDYEDAALQIKAANDVSHTAITFGAGDAGNVGVQGMVGYMEGVSNSLVSIDDEALLQADGTGTNAGVIKIAALNDTVATNVAGGLAMGLAAGVGASAAVNSYDINSMAVVGDNDADAEDTYVNSEAAEGEKEKDAASKVRELVQNVAKLPDGKEAKDIFGSKDTNAGGKITARELHAAAQNDSMINSVSVAGGVTTGDDGEVPSIFDKLGNWGSNKINKVTNKISTWDKALSNKITNNQNMPNYAPDNMQASNKTEGMELPEFTVAGAGSVSLNIIDGSTAAVLDGAKIALTPDADKQSALSVKAEDASFIGAWSGAAGISWKNLTTDQNANNTSVGIAGAFGINVTDTQALAQIKNSAITDAASIVNEAQKSGALVAAGLGLSLTVDESSNATNVAIAGSSSVNDADNKVQALMQGNNIGVSENSGIKTQITNSAYDSDTQVTGGLNVSLDIGGKSGAAVGGTLNYADVDNIVESKISGGNYSGAGAVDVRAVTDITQVGVGVGVGVAAGGSGTSASVEGVAVYNRLNNDVDAVIDGAAIAAEKVGVRAYDSDSGNKKKYDEYIDARGLDATGASYIESAKDASDVSQGVLDSPGKSGNTIATGALSLAINAKGEKSAGVGAAVAVSDIYNDFNAAINNSNITAAGTSDASATAADVIVDAKSDTLLVGVAAGAAGSSKVSVAGSATWQNLHNDVTASIDSSAITSGSTSVKATTGSLAVNVTGQVSAGKVAVGLALAQTSVENTTGAYVKGSTITANTYKDVEVTDSETGETNTEKQLVEAEAGTLEVAAQNAGKQYTVAAGVSASLGTAAVNGAVTVNRGHNNVEAIVDANDDGARSVLENMQSVNVHTQDNSTLAAGVGGVSAGVGTAVGGAVAYNEIGDISGGKDAKKQTNKAQINNTALTTADAGSVKVEALDTSTLTTVAVGVGVSAANGVGVAVQGAAATALVNKATEASLASSNISQYGEGATKADVTVKADSKASLTTSADVASVAVGNTAVAVGAGVAVSRSQADTRALVNGGTQDVQNLNVQAQSEAVIESIGVGIGASVGGGTGVGVSGNVAVNLIDNDTTAKISGGAAIAADNNVGVVAVSDERISNYAGTLAAGVSGGAGVGVGVSVSVNEINGSTTAAIGDSEDEQVTQVIALGKGNGLKTRTKIEDSEIHDTLISENTISINSKIDRSEETRKGVIVDASSTHDIKSFLVNAAVGAGEVAVGVAGTVNVNSIGGETSATVQNATLNGGVNGSGEAGDVSVKAGDYTNSAGFVGSLGVGGGIGAGVGLGSDTNLVKRATLAQVTDSDIQAAAFDLDAVSRQGVSSFTVGSGIAGVGGGVAGVVTVTQLQNTTQALLDEVSVKANTASINADHLAITHAGNVSLGGAGVGAGVGLSVGVLKDNSRTEAVVGGSVADNGDKEATVIDSASDITVKAQNHTKVAPTISATGVAGLGAGVAGATSVNNINSTVKATVNNARLNSTSGKIDVGADNKLTVDAYLGGNAAGAVGVGASVSVNTIDSTVQANVTNSILSAGSDVSVTAEEEREITQLATNASAGGAAVGANIAVTNIGKKISGDDENNKAVVDAIEQANNAYGDTDLLGTDYTFGALKQAGTTVTKPTVGAEVGGGKDSQITVNINNADITSGAAFKAEAKERGEIKMTLGSGAAGGVAVNAGVGILNVHRNVGVNMNAAKVKAQNIDIDSSVNGGATLNVYQGSAGVIGANAAYGGVTTDGFSKINITGGSLNGESIDILAGDSGTTDVNALGVTVGAVALGAIVTKAENGSDTQVNISGAELTAAKSNTETEKDKASVSIKADKANSVTAHATGGIGGVLSGSGVVATAKDNGSAKITVQDGSKLTAEELALQAVNKPAVKAAANSVSVSLLGGASAAAATAAASGSANVTVQNSAGFSGAANTLAADVVNINAVVGAQSGKNTVEAEAEGNSGSIGGNVTANVAEATADMDAVVNVGDAAYKTQSEEIVYKTTYKDDGTKEEHKRTVTVGATQLNIKGENTTSVAADARGVTVGIGFASGNNVAKTRNNTDINISLQGGGSEAALLKGLSVNAGGAARNTTTADGSGGALVSGDLAAYVDSDIVSNINATISGKFNVAGDVKVEAVQNDYAELNADATKATVVGASATKAENDIQGTNKVTLQNADIAGGGTVTVTADNSVTMGEKYKYAVEGSGYGGVNVQGAEYDNTVNKSAAVRLQNAKLVSDGAQTVAAQTTGDILTGGYIKAAGAGAFTWVDVDNSITTANSVTVDKDSSLKTLKAEQDITVSASDNMEIKATAVADTQGAAVGGASADLSDELKRTNTVTVQGDLYSMHDVNLYAGKDRSGKEGMLNLTLESEAYNKTALGFGKPKLKNAMTQNNSVTVSGDGDVSSVRHINVYADAGAETVRETDIMYNWYYSEGNDSYTSSTVGDKEPTNKTANNFVQLDGRLTAGVQNKQHLTIGKQEGQLVFLDEATLNAVKNYGNGQQSAIGGSELLNNHQIDASSGVDTDRLVVGTMDYGTELFKRYNELGELMNEYSEDETASLGYMAERQRILNEMESLGLVQTVQDVDGNNVVMPVEGMTIDYISLPDIVASGGNINIQTDTLSGSGELAAQGSPEVTITNNTNLYLKVNDVLVGEQGGEINYNNVNLTQAEYAVQIAGLNSDKEKTVNFSVFKAEAGTGGGTITINGAYSGTEVKANVTDSDGKTVTAQLTPKADIEINGNVISEDGAVHVTSAANSIIIQGADANSSASVQGKEVHLTAAKGSVSQGYHEGITNIGGDVQTQYKNQYNQAVDNFIDKYGDKNQEGTDKKKDFSKTGNVKENWTGQPVSSNGNMIAGENIYINASDINVNGYIQSGFAKYELIIDESVQKTINEIQSNWQQQGGPALSDAVVTSGSAYRIVAGGVKNGETTTYQVEAYYNPSTGKIVVPDVDAQGGRVYLTGRISSTGSGKINVLDGAYDISVTNNTGSDLQLGKLESNDVEGLISITDTATKTVTEFYRDKTIVTNLTNNEEKTEDASNVYNPQTGLRYNWTTGKETTTVKEYTHTHKAGLWGAITTINKEEMTKYENSTTPTTFETTDDKKNGEYIGGVNGIDNDADFVVISSNKSLWEATTSPTVKTWRSGFLSWFKWEKLTWQKKTGTAQTYVGSVKADKPIEIGFFGNADGKAAITVTSTGSVDLTGSVKTTANDNSKIDITTQGALNGLGGTLTGDNINLKAQDGMSNILVNSLGDTVRLNAVNSGSGDVDIAVNAAYGKEGNVLLDTLSTKSGAVSLTAQGNITQQGGGVAVSADRIDLTSTGGAIGTAEQALIVHGGQIVTDATDSLSASVNANARGNIYLTQDSGDMRLGRVYSDQGDVSITVNNGDLVDALPAGRAIDRGDTEALLQKWRDLGLIAGEGDFTAKQEQDVVEYKASVAEEFAIYAQQKAYYAENTFDEQSATAAEKASYASYLALAERYENYATADDYLASEAAQANIADLQKNGAGWDENQLLYAIQDSIINPDSGATYNEVKDPNLKGKNITLNVKGSVGLNSDEDVVIGLKGLYEDSRLDNLKALTSADASSVTWDKSNGQAIINQKYPLGVQLASGGKLNVTAQDNVYLAGRTEDNANAKKNVLNIELVQGGNIRLQGQNGIYNVRTDDAPAIIGDNLLIQAGEGSIGGDADKNDGYMNVRLSGAVQAQAGQNISLRQLGDSAMQITSMGAGKDISLLATGNIVSVSGALGDEEDAAQGYIKSDGGVINITSAAGSVGTEKHALRIHNTDNAMQLVNVTAEKGDVNLYGVSNSSAQEAPASGSLNLGNVTAGGAANVDVNGSAAVSESGKITATSANVQAAQNVVIDGAIEAADTIIAANGGDVTLNGSVTAASANVQAAQNVVIDGSVEAADTTIAANGGDVTLNGSVTANKEADITAQNDVQLAASGSIDAGAVAVESGRDTVIAGTVDAGGAVNVTAQANAGISGFVETEKDVVVNAQANVNVSGQVIAGGVADIDAVSDVQIGGQVTAGGALTANAGQNLLLDGGSMEAKGAITATAANDMTLNGSVIAKGQNNIMLSAGKNISVGGDITQSKASVTLNAGNDVLLNSGALTAAELYISDTAENVAQGAITQGAEHTITANALYAAATKGIALTSGNNELQSVDLWNAGKGDVSLTNNGKHDLSVIVEQQNNGNITIVNNRQDGANSSVNVLSPLKASGSVSVTNNAGDVNLTQNGTVDTHYNGKQTVDKAAAAGGDITVTGAGAINSGNALDAGKNINLQAANDITVNGSANAQAGSVVANTTTGDISYSGTVSAGESVTAKADAGNVSYSGNVDAKAGNVNAETTTGDISYSGTVNAGEDVIVATGTGSITLDGAVNGGQDISLYTDSGSMEINSSVTAANGDIILVINTQGDIFDADDSKGSLKAINGNAIVINDGLGDIDLDEIYALETVLVDLSDGNLHLREINGRLVAVALKSEGHIMDIKHTVAASQILLNGSSLDLDDIEQRLDGDGMLVITPGGASDDKPIDSFSIGGIKTNNLSGIRFENLWVNNADITINEGKVSFDKLFVENKAEITNKGMTTTVYGSSPVWNGSNSVYWHNTSVNRPEANLDAWLNGDGGDWVYLHFGETRGVQHSNAVLLHLQDHYYAYEQRFSGVGYLRYLQSDISGAGYDLQQIPVNHYNRFDNYELPVFDDHAEAHELELHDSSI